MNNTTTILVGAALLYLLLRPAPVQAAPVQTQPTTTAKTQPTPVDLAKDAIDLLGELYNAFKAD